MSDQLEPVNIFDSATFAFPTELRFVKMHNVVRLFDTEYDYYIELQEGGDVTLVTLRKLGPEIRAEQPDELIGMPYKAIGRTQIEDVIERAYDSMLYQHEQA